MDDYLVDVDLAPFADIDEAKASAMIADATAQAILAAPCLAEPANLTDHQRAAVKAVLRGAILRWDEAGAGGVTQHQQTAGPFSESMTIAAPQRRGLFWPTELEQLEAVCKAVTGSTAGGAWSINAAPRSRRRHADACSLNLGANFCSCGANLAGSPLWEGCE
jgi:hypothetical protein